MAKQHKDCSVEELEERLASFQRRGASRSTAKPQSARDMLETNKALIEAKVQKVVHERKSEQVQIEKLLEGDRLTVEGEKAEHLNRRSAHRELALSYKEGIQDNERMKSQEYGKKIKSGPDSIHFPFIEGETIDKHRQAQRQNLSVEMRGFLTAQRKENPPRADALLSDVDKNPRHLYPMMSATGAQKISSAEVSAFASSPAALSGAEDVAPHIGAQYPRFLSRAREHMSRRIHDGHVRKALEDKVEQTKQELEAKARKREGEVSAWHEGLATQDAVKEDFLAKKARDRQDNAAALRVQIAEKKQQNQTEVCDWRAAPSGYYGPEEKELQGVELYERHCGDLIKQMEVNQHRKLDERHRRLRQEQKLVDNSMVELQQDRARDREKVVKHRQVLTTTWKSQQRIKEAKVKVEQIGY